MTQIGVYPENDEIIVQSPDGQVKLSNSNAKVPSSHEKIGVINKVRCVESPVRTY